ncbi:E3 ubiquitin-protein ligase ATL6-like [Beta vulgaris subsp. vulgaris]|uniref:E3 ubiquitin-protein ligase ATL6-like n=1 Tax=Beta vulgaris subsp. vulgaris TaxID=3555 RepID=UPI00203754F4|nr:E3 ubiquitin-protein ligase ATL6-like [Beta vulgaris subsp. vulgaris]
MQHHKKHILFSILLFLLLTPSYVGAQQESFKGNAGEPFTPSTIIIIILGIIFMFTGCLAVFLRQFSAGCFGLNVIPINPGVTSDGQLATHGLDAEVIKSIPTYFYADVKQHRKGQVELECAVCLYEFQDAEALRLLPGCKHVFHPRCIDQWLATHVTCPICRQSLEPESGTITKPHSIINIINPDTTQIDQSDGSNHDQDNHVEEEEYHDCNDVKKIIVGKFPRSHSTGHSMAGSERFTLVLPEEVQNNLPDRSKLLSSILSPRSAIRCGWFSMTPPVTNPRSGSVRSLVSSGLVINSSKKLALPPVKTSADRLWPI